MQTAKWSIRIPCSPPIFPTNYTLHTFRITSPSTSSCINGGFKLRNQGAFKTCCRARRRARYEEDEVDEENGYNEEIAMLEFYSQTAREEALLVNALVNEEEVQVLIFKGFSSCLTYGTSPDPSTSVIPANAVIKSVDRIKGPFDPSNIEYLEKGLEWETFKTRLT